MRREVPWSTWIVGLLTATVLAGGVAQVVAERTPPTVETTVRDEHILPAGQSILRGIVTSLEGTDVVGPPIPLPVEIVDGTATIEAAIVDGRRSTIAWNGGRPLVLDGDGGLELGPTRVRVDATGAASWPLGDGVQALRPGRYSARAPVAVGSGGLAEPRDAVELRADAGTTLVTHGAGEVRTPARALHLEGPGSLVLDGRFTVRTAAGRRTATHLEFGPGPFVVDLTPQPAGLELRATLQGALRGNTT